MTTIDAAYTHAYRRPDARPPPPAYAIPAAAMDSDGSLERAPDAFLLAFEPLLDKYATLLARGGPRFNGRGVVDRAVPLGHHHPRAVVLPIAVAPARATRSAAATAGRADGGAADAVAVSPPAAARAETSRAGGGSGLGHNGAGAADGGAGPHGAAGTHGGAHGGAPVRRHSAHGVSYFSSSSVSTINVSRIAGCSSLVPFNEATAWGAQCFQHHGTLESRQAHTRRAEPRTLDSTSAGPRLPTRVPAWL